MHSSWDANAGLWTAAVRSGTIASRRLGTDGAVLGAVLRHRPERVLDVGCGEGWLCRALASEVAERVGIDASQALIANAKEAGGGIFHHADFAAIAAGGLLGLGRFDVAVANFALLDEDLQPLLLALRELVKDGGVLIVQTVHPATLPLPYRNGWREETFAAFDGRGGWKPMPWFYRTTGSWLNEIARYWRVGLVEEPIDPSTGMPMSLLMTSNRM